MSLWRTESMKTVRRWRALWWSGPRRGGAVSAGGTWVLPFAIVQGGAVIVVPHDTLMLTEDHIMWLDAPTTDVMQALLVSDEATSG